MSFSRQRVEAVYVVLVAVHSVVAGLMLMLTPHFAVDFGGWHHVAPTFFVRQGGVFHLVVAAGYLIEYYRYRGITLLVTAKSIAFVFLLLYTVLGNPPWVVPVCGVGDGAMAVLAVLIRRWAGTPSTHPDTGCRMQDAGPPPTPRAS